MLPFLRPGGPRPATSLYLEFVLQASFCTSFFTLRCRRPILDSDPEGEPLFDSSHFPDLPRTQDQVVLILRFCALAENLTRLGAEFPLVPWDLRFHAMASNKFEHLSRGEVLTGPRG